MQKYEITDIVHPRYLNLFRIRALVDIPRYRVKAGELGGYIQSEDNLAQEGDCWVGRDALVYGSAWVYDNARVWGYARVYGNACVSGNAKVSGNALVYGNAKVSGNALVFRYARVYDNAHVFGNARVYGSACVFGEIVRVYKDMKINSKFSDEEYLTWFMRGEMK